MDNGYVRNFYLKAPHITNLQFNSFAYLVVLFSMNRANIETPTPRNAFFVPPPPMGIITA